MKSKSVQVGIALSAAVLSAVPLMGVAYYAEDEVQPPPAWVGTEHEQMMRRATDKNTIAEIVDLFNKHVNKTDVPWQVDGVEFSAPVYISDLDSYGAYVDFSGDSGYMLITFAKTDGDKNIFYLLASEGDLEALRGESVLYFNFADGFCKANDRIYWENIRELPTGGVGYPNNPTLVSDEDYNDILIPSPCSASKAKKHAD
ncbi:MAG: hypothetical protein J1F69_03875 [Clostridiales bacterium]|nr:hypothetical protein [Clostridiales bacterium]